MKNRVIHPFIPMTEIKSISVSSEFSNLAREHGMSWSEAARIGMAVLLAEKGVREYDNNLNIFRKLNLVRQTMQATIDGLNEELDELKKRVENK